MFLANSCNSGKDTDALNDSDAVQMEKIIIENSDTLFFPPDELATTFFLVRHAEKRGEKNPSLTKQGFERADILAEILSTVDLHAVYSTDYNRTQQTAEPTAVNQGLTTQIYNGKDLESSAKSILEKHKMEKVLIVGHSNTTPDFINQLIGSNEYEHLSESQFDNLFIVTIPENGTPEVVNLKYGKATP